MPIRGFDKLTTQQSTRRLPLKVVHDTVIAIDGSWYIKKYHSSYSMNDLLDFDRHVESILKPLYALARHTQILWIWDGLDHKKCKGTRDLLTFRVSDAVTKLKRSLVVRNVFDSEMYVQPVTSRLRSAGITVIRAPHAAMAQCAYFLRENCVKYIFSKNDALLFDACYKVITDISFTNETIEVVDRNTLLQDNGINLPTLRCISFLSGCEACPTIPMFANDFDIIKVIDLLREGDLIQTLQKYHKSVNPKIGFESSAESKYLTLFFQSFFLFTHHPVMTLNAGVKCLETRNIPNDLDKLFGKPLPAKLYRELFMCEISPILLNLLVNDTPVEDPVKKEFLREFIKELDRADKEGDKKNRVLDGNIESIKRILDENVEFSKDYNPVIQALFLKLQPYGFDRRLLLGMLNSGYVNKTGDDLNEIKTVDSDTLLFYLQVCEYFIIMRDLIRLVGVLNGEERPLEGELHSIRYRDFITEWDKKSIEEFLKNNEGIIKR